MDDLLSLLDEEFVDVRDSLVCLVVHNIEGPALRDLESQQCLAQIASCSYIRMIASIDHVNAPLLWDKKMVHKQFSWCWCHVPTFAPYKVEGVFFPLILASGTAAQNARTATIVLQSLTPNAQSVFKALAEFQLANEEEEGMPLSTLYTKCRERFLVSTQATLNAHLTEFRDHALVKTRRHSDGQECFYIPLSSEALQKLLSDLG
ncbi:hypothetical protein HPP92_015820 [Vanilla planifolia]|uniref:Origin recognition complex subunit 2 n=2 Tax=Vanilla planifolia TaxID=51239 RepID=A0A835QF05_VANPL|nr:hypothetical protein HPP92_015820 [Vanilla planifolia]